MNLLAIRKLFVQHSGRHDLVHDVQSYADNGADFFINAGLRILDDKVEVGKNESIREIELEKGQAIIKLPLVRVPEKVRIVGSDDGSIFLTRMTYYDFRRKYGEGNDEGLPASYSMLTLRSNGLSAEDAGQKAIIIGPKPEHDYMMYVSGQFYSDPLLTDEDVNFWSVEYPHTLIQAALYAMERFYRNTQGMNDHMLAIERDIEGIDHEDVAEAIRYRSNMADSFNEKHGKHPRNYGIK